MPLHLHYCVREAEKTTGLRAFYRVLVFGRAGACAVLYILVMGNAGVAEWFLFNKFLEFEDERGE